MNSFRNLWDCNKKSHAHIIGFPEGEEENDAETLHQKRHTDDK